MRKEKLKQFQDQFNEKLSIAEDEEKKGKENQKTNELSKENFKDNFIKKIKKILNIKIKEDNLAHLSTHLYNIYNNLYKEFDQKMNDFVIIHGDLLFNRYYKEYQNLDIENHSEILKLFDTTFLEQAKSTIKKELDKVIKNQVLPKIFTEIEANLLEWFKAIIDEYFNNIILSNESIRKELQSQVDKLVNASYDAIYKKIQKCREKNSKQSDFYEDENIEKKENNKDGEKNKDHNEFLDDISD
jgi:hypothetical protein